MKAEDRAREVARQHNAKEKSQIAAAVGLAVYARMHQLAQTNNQLVGEENDLYVTLEQLERAFCDLRDELGITQQQAKVANGLKVLGAGTEEE